jgi:hypothetical protein
LWEQLDLSVPVVAGVNEAMMFRISQVDNCDEPPLGLALLCSQSIFVSTCTAL